MKFILRTLISLFLLCVFSNANAQNCLWAKEGLDAYTLNPPDEELSVCTDANGNVYSVGAFMGDSITFGAQLLINSNLPANLDPFIVKYDSNGNVLWAKSAAGCGEAFSVCTDGSGNVLVTGTFYSQSITFGSYTLSSPNYPPQVFIVKYDASGNVLWAEQSQAFTNQFFYRNQGQGVTTDANGNIFVTGYFDTPVINFGSISLTSLGGAPQFFLVKYDASGNVLWATSAGSVDIDVGCSVKTDLSGNIFATGYYDNTITFGSSVLTTPIYPLREAFIVKYDAAGNVLWAHQSSSAAWQNYATLGTSITTDNYGNAYMAGSSDAHIIHFGLFTLTSAIGQVFIVKYDSAGNVLSAMAGKGGDFWTGASVALDGNGNLFLGGIFLNPYIIFGSDTLRIPQNGNNGLFLSEFDSSFNLVCSSVLSTESTTQGNGAITADANGNAYQCGSFQVNPLIIGADSLPLTGYQNVFLAKFNCACSNLSITGSTIVCSGSSLYLSTNLAGTNYNWSTGDTTNGITVTPSAATTYSLVVSSGSCTDTLYKTISVDTVPVSGIGSFNNVSCSGAHNGSATLTTAFGIPPFTYQWLPAGGTNATGTFMGVGTYTCTVTDVIGCTTTSSVTITQPTQTVISSSSTPIVCINQGSITTSVSGGTPPYSYYWNPTSQVTSTINVPAPGTYTVTVTDSNGCLTVQQITVSHQDSILNSIASTTPSDCSSNNGSANVSVTGGIIPYSYSWIPYGGNNSNAINLSAGSYTVTATDANGCSITQSLTISNPPLPIVSTGNDTTIILGSHASLSSSSGVNYNWSPVTDLSCTNCPNPIACPVQTTIYCVVITDTNDCTNTACEKVIVRDDCPIYIPNAFSPNNDNENDLECVRSNCILSMYFAIYDRWGQKVFETSEQNFCWDGTYKGEKLEPAVFTYMFEGILLDGNKISKNGNISLAR